MIVNNINELLDLDFDNDTIFDDLSYNFELNFKDSHIIKNLAHELFHLYMHIPANGISTYFDHIEDEIGATQALESLKTINSPNYEILKESLNKIKIDDDGQLITENYDDSEEWNKWSNEDSKLLLNWIDKNKEKFHGQSDEDNDSQETESYEERIFKTTGFRNIDMGPLDDHFHSHYLPYKPEYEITNEEFYVKLKNDKTFRSNFELVILTSHFIYSQFETPPINCQNLNQKFEFVIYSGELYKNADLKPFKSLFENSNENIIVHHNSNENCTYIIPNMIHKHKNVYKSWKSFIERAPREQVDELLSTLGEVVLDLIREESIWVHVSNKKVNYLHFRIDSKPTLYKHEPYKS